MPNPTEDPKLIKLQETLDALRAEYNALGERVTAAYNDVNNYTTSLIEATPGITPDNVLMLLQTGDHIQASHNQLNAYVSSLPGLWRFTYFSSRDDKPEGMFGYASFEFLPEKSASMDDVHESAHKFVDTFSPYHVSRNGDMIISFMENGLSLGAAYDIVWRPDTDQARLREMVRGSESTETEGTLLEVLNYVQKHHHYGEPYGYDEDDY